MSLDGGWKIIVEFPDSELLVVKKLAEKFKNSGDALLMNCLVTVEKPAPQENWTGNTVVVNRNGGGLKDNNAFRDDIFTVQTWGFDYDETSYISRKAENLFQTIYGDGIAECSVEISDSRVPMIGEEKLRFFTVNVLVAGSSQS